MNKRNLLSSVVIAVLITFGCNAAYAQLNDRLPSSSNDPSKKSNRLAINTGFDFLAGDTVLFAENFSEVAVAASTDRFKTNGSATIVSMNDESGKWLALADNATYKLAKQLFYPKNFTLEFDILASADQIKDIYPVKFGFINDNSVKEYNSGSGAHVSLLYFNDNEVVVSSSFTDKYLSSKFDLTTYANRKMHVSITVDGNRMIVYLDQTKLADTEMFLPATAKNFYISGPMQYDNGAKVLVSNFKIMGFKKR